MTGTPHTPTPWEQNGRLVYVADDLANNQEKLQFLADCNSEDTAAYIVKCVNAHSELLIIAKKMASFIENNVTCETNEIYLAGQQLQDQLDDVLKKVGE